MTRVFLFICLILISCESQNNKVPMQQTTHEITIESVQNTIKTYIYEQSNDNGDYFNFKNDSLNVNLKLKKIHQLHIPINDSNSFSVCVAMASDNGDLYDIDFFLKKNKDSIRVERTQLYEFDDQPLYVWDKDSSGSWITIPIKKAPKKLMNVIENEDNFTFHYDVTIPQLTENAKMWIPIVQTNRFQTVEILSQEIPVEHKVIKDSVFGNKVLYVELKPGDSGKKIALNYKVLRKEKKPYLDPKADINLYLKDTPLLPVGGKFTKIDADIFEKANAKTDVEKARAIYDYIIAHMRYTKQVKHGTGDAYYACDMLAGNCTEFHSYFITLARTAHIPARFFIGTSIPSNEDSGEIGGYHCWVEFYAESKWWPIDISEAFKYTPLRDYFFGHNPANRILFTQGRELKLNPAPEEGLINFFAYPILEVNGKSQKADNRLSFERN